MAVIDAEAMAMTVALQQMTTLFVSRPRPYVEDCNVTLSPDLNDCVRSSRFRSFYSGHTSMAFTSASLVCAHRARLTLFGPTADVVMCAGAFVAATATATLRIMGDMHNASDVIVGALVGTAVGLGVPALHYANHDRSTASLLPGGYELSVYPTGTGVGLAVVY
jgi:membrane-associated phospholipid phosphatase